MTATQAWEMINDPDRCNRLTMGDFEELLRRAGYSSEVAHKAAMQRGWDRLCAGELM